MISGTVNADLEAVVPLTVVSSAGDGVPFDGIVDTGFTGFLTLPHATISQLGLQFEGREQIVLADGRMDLCDVFAGVVLWGTESRQILIEAAATDPLVGMALMRGHDIHIRVVAGGPVTIERF